MSRQRYTEEFKIAAVKQVIERGHPIIEVAAPSICLENPLAGHSYAPPYAKAYKMNML